MEIPEPLARLYRHLPRHARAAPSGRQPANLNAPLYGRFIAFAAERQRAWERKERGLRTLSDDPILSRFRFCNVYRELDRQTAEIHEWLAPLGDDLELWLLNLAAARMICRPETSRAIGYLTPGRDNLRAAEALRSLPRPRYGNAYVFPVSSIVRTETPTREEFFSRYLPQRSRAMADAVRSLDGAPVAAAVDVLTRAIGVPLRFHSTEILIDVAYRFPDRIDLFGPFPIGPGAARTIAALAPGSAPEVAVSALAAMGAPEEFPFLTLGGKKIFLSAENFEGLCCEWRKYENLASGTGRRRLFRK